MTVKPFAVKDLSIIEGNYAFLFKDKQAAMNALKKNPRASYMPGEEGEVVLVYASQDIDLTRAIKRA